MDTQKGTVSPLNRKESSDIPTQSTKVPFDKCGVATKDIEKGIFLFEEMPFLWTSNAEIYSKSLALKEKSERHLFYPTDYVQAMDEIALIKLLKITENVKQCKSVFSAWKAYANNYIKKVEITEEHTGPRVYQRNSAMDAIYDHDATKRQNVRKNKSSSKDQLYPIRMAMKSNNGGLNMQNRLDIFLCIQQRRLAFRNDVRQIISYAIFGTHLFRFRHSCTPNCFVYMKDIVSDDRIVIVHTLRRIEKGEPCTISYVDTYSSHHGRKEQLLELYGRAIVGRCPCVRCSNVKRVLLDLTMGQSAEYHAIHLRYLKALQLAVPTKESLLEPYCLSPEGKCIAALTLLLLDIETKKEAEIIDISARHRLLFLISINLGKRLLFINPSQACPHLERALSLAMLAQASDPLMNETVADLRRDVVTAWDEGKVKGDEKKKKKIEKMRQISKLFYKWAEGGSDSTIDNIYKNNKKKKKNKSLKGYGSTDC